MFKLYYFSDRQTSNMVFSNEELSPCLVYIRSRGLVPQRCIIVSPNNRRITFNNANEMVFGVVAA